MDSFVFEEGKLYKWKGGCVYVAKRQKTSLRCIVLWSDDSINLGGKKRKIDHHFVTESTFRFSCAAFLKSNYKTEFIEINGDELFAIDQIENYKCPLVFTGTLAFKLKPLRDAGVEFTQVFCEVTI